MSMIHSCFMRSLHNMFVFVPNISLGIVSTKPRMKQKLNVGHTYRYVAMAIKIWFYFRFP